MTDQKPNLTYRHFKGGIYERIGHAKCADALVLYRRLGDDQVWSRLAADFFGPVPDGSGPRFERVEAPS